MEDFKDFILNLRAIGKEILLPWQEGILLNIAALPRLLENLMNDPENVNKEISCIPTRKINQDDLEHYFGMIRMQGHGASRPSRSEFMGRVKTLMLSTRYYLHVLWIVIIIIRFSRPNRRGAANKDLFERPASGAWLAPTGHYLQNL